MKCLELYNCSKKRLLNIRHSFTPNGSNGKQEIMQEFHSKNYHVF